VPETVPETVPEVMIKTEVVMKTERAIIIKTVPETGS
jgi:hypothetical protein